MRTAIVGSRTFKDYEFLTRKLKDFNITHVVSGGAIGTDSLAEAWAIQHDIPYTIYKPDWNKHGKAAGFMRNKTIIEDVEVVIAFWNGISKGTAHSIDIARARKKQVFIILV